MYTIKTLGIVGMGRIGMALAQRAHFGFGMPILYNARRQHPQAEERFNARYCDLDTLLQGSGFRLPHSAAERRDPPPVRRSAVCQK